MYHTVRIQIHFQIQHLSLIKYNNRSVIDECNPREIKKATSIVRTRTTLEKRIRPNKQLMLNNSIILDRI